METVRNGRVSNMDIPGNKSNEHKTSRLEFCELQVDGNAFFTWEVVVAKQVLHKASLTDCHMCVSCHLRMPGLHFALMAPLLHRLPPATSDS